MFTVAQAQRSLAIEVCRRRCCNQRLTTMPSSILSCPCTATHGCPRANTLLRMLPNAAPAVGFKDSKRQQQTKHVTLHPSPATAQLAVITKRHASITTPNRHRVRCIVVAPCRKCTNFSWAHSHTGPPLQPARQTTTPTACRSRTCMLDKHAKTRDTDGNPGQPVPSLAQCVPCLQQAGNSRAHAIDATAITQPCIYRYGTVARTHRPQRPAACTASTYHMAVECTMHHGP